MAVKVGDTFISLHVNSDGSLDWTDHVVRTIRGGKIYAIAKNVCTWGKRSKKHGDFGWLPNIHPMFRTSWRVGEKRPESISATRLQAVQYEIYLIKEYGEPEDYDTPEIEQKVLPRLQKLKAKYSKRKSGCKKDRQK